MPIDATIPLKGSQPPKPINFGELASQAANIAHTGLTNKLLRAQVAAGKDFQQNVSPNGEVNVSGYMQALTHDPDAAAYAPEAYTKTQQAIGAWLQNKGLNIEQGRKRLEAIGNATASLLQNKDISDKDVVNAVTPLVQEGVLTPKEAAAEISGLPSDPQQRRARLQSLYTSAQHGAMALAPHIQDIQNGAGHILYNVNPAAGNGVGELGYVKNQLTPVQENNPIGFTGTNNRQITTTLGQIQKHGGQLPTGTGFSPVVAGNSPQENAAQAVMGKGQGEMGSKIFGETQNLSESRAAVQGVLSELDSANPGPMAESFSKLGSALSELGIKGLDQASSYQLLEKGQSQLIVSRVSSALGVPTDSKMSQISAQTPGGHMTKEAAKGAAAQIAGILDYKQAEANAAQKEGVQNDPTKSFEFNNKWQREYPNAAVFQFAHLPMALKKRYWQKMSASEREKFHSQYSNAAKNGFVPDNPFEK